ncbi:related to EBP2-required for pre-rRNA processing and ribosomal subunit assembly [Sporisorium scitamineum]|uniref:Related to EBP2-required for pre-rRNA processing and ribosomal subunit assembly n=1 Tax=Sporisorium scitamineum TaxID=49012 RepID=A0A127Z7Z9_9BASI|nr:related to EBP2-required for pre-rRNA processing and ribosomal subunit assembly [Sporisorium scitamineum]
MLATPKSTPRKAAANGSSTPAASPSTASTPSRLTRAQARASGTPIKTPSPLKKGGSISTPKASSKKAAASAAAVEEKEHDTPSPSKPKSKTPTKVATPAKSSPKSASSKKKSSPAKIDTETPRKVLASHAKLTRIPTSALATAEPIVAEYSDEEDEEEEGAAEVVENKDEDEESDLEEGQDVSEKGMQRLMAALGEDGLDEVDMAALDELAGEEDDDDEEEDGNDDEDAEEDDEAAAAAEQDDDIPRVVPNASGDTLAASIARSGLAEAVEESDDEEDEEEEDGEEEDDEGEAIAYEDLPDDIELSEQAKASRTQRIKINNEPALRRMYEDIRLDSPTSSSKLPWIETMRITYPTSISTEVTDVENDLERELAFYKQALHAAVEGKKLVQASGTPFTRPSDYFAEMVKTDEHMERIRQKLLDESAAIKASEAAKKQRELKKFGKKVQVEKLQERIRNKKELNERIAGLKRKHGSIEDASGADADEFDVRLEEAIGGPSAAADTKKPKLTAKRAPTNKAKMPRNARDAKYGFGGKKRYSKSNTAESTNDFSLGPTRGARGSKPKVTSGKTGFRAKQKSGAAKRPGKARRAAGH